MNTIANITFTKFDVQDVVIVIRPGTYANTAGVVIEIVQVGAPGNTSIMYRVDMLDGNILTVDENDLMDFETWLDDQDELNDAFGTALRTALAMGADQVIHVEGDKECECGSEKVNSNKHSSWCPKYDS